MCITMGIRKQLLLVFMSDKFLTLCKIYLPPGLDNNVLGSELDKILKSLENPCIIMADANAHHITWGSDYCDRRGKIVDDWVFINDLAILNSGSPTFVSNRGNYFHIDVTIASRNISTSLNWETLPELYNSDHFPVCINSRLDTPIVTRPRRWCLSSAKWDAYRSLLVLPNEFLSPTITCDCITNSIKKAEFQSVKISECPVNNNYCKAWWNEKCYDASVQKKKAFNRYKK